MVRSFLTILLAVSCWTLPEAPDPAASSNVGTPQTAAPAAPASPESQVEPWTTGKVSLVRGLLKSVDPIHDVLVVHVFGGGDLRILFDARTQLFQKNSRMRATGLTPGTVVSVDTVIDNGKLFARTVRTDSSNAGELNGQVVRYDAGASQVTIRDAMSPKEISLRITGATAFVSQGQASSPQALSPGTLVRVQFSPVKDEANSIEILARRGQVFTFAGRVLSVDLRSRVIALSNDSDHSVHEVAIGSLDATSLRLLREGADVNIQTEFDGNHYKARSVTLVSSQP